MSNPPSSRERRRQTFKDLALLANAPQPPSSAAPATAESSGRFDLRASSAATEGLEIESAPLQSAPMNVPAATPPARGSRSKRRSVLYAASGLVVLVAGLVLALRGGIRSERAPMTAAPRSETIAPAASTSAGRVQGVTRPESLTTAEANIATAPATLIAPARSTKAGAKNGRKRDRESTPPLEEKMSAPSDRPALGEAIKNAVGPRSDEPRAGAVESREGATPAAMVESPPTGALRAALGVALPAARACLGPDDAISRAEVVFASRGTVKEVHVKGGAAGKPAEGCVAAALAKATVEPFRRETYTTIVTVRAIGGP